MINLTELFDELGVMSTNNTASNQYEFFKEVLWSDGEKTYNQYEFFQKAAGSRYAFFQAYGSEYDFYKDIDDTNITDFNSFYKNVSGYLCNVDSAKRGVVLPVDKFPYLWYLGQAFDIYKDNYFKITDTKPVIQFTSTTIVDFPDFTINQSFKVNLTVEIFDTVQNQVLIKSNNANNLGLFKRRSGLVQNNRLSINFLGTELISSLIPSEGWHYIEWEYNHITFEHTLKVDGVVGTWFTPALVPTTNVLNINGGVMTQISTSGNFFAGELAEFEIEGFLHYKFTEGTGTQLYDCLNFNRGTISGTFTWEFKRAVWSARRNMLRNTNFSANWTYTQLVIQPQFITSPYGNLRLFIPVSGTSQKLALQTLAYTANTTYTFSVYAKKKEFSAICLIGSGYSGWAGALPEGYFDLENGVSRSRVAQVTTNIEHIGDGIYRCSMTLTAITTATVAFNVAVISDYNVNGSASTTANGTDGLFFGLPQVEVGTVATPFQETDATGVVSDTIWTSIDPSTGNLVEGVNLLSYSNDFSNTVWSKGGVTLTPNSTTAPNGVNTGWKLNCVAFEDSVKSIAQSIEVTNDNTFTTSIYAKAAELNSLVIHLQNKYTNDRAVGTFNLLNGTTTSSVSGIFTNVVASAYNASNGWYRCVITATTDGSPLDLESKFFLGTSASYAAGAVSGIHIWTAQKEVGSEVSEPQITTVSTGVSGDLKVYSLINYANEEGYSVGKNMLIWSNDFTQTAWTKIGLTVSSRVFNSIINKFNHTLTENSASTTQHRLLQSVPQINTSTTYTIYLEVKRGVGTRHFQFGLGLGGGYNVKAYYDMGTGTVGFTQNSTANIENSDDSFFLCSVTFTTPSTISERSLYLAMTNATTNGAETYSGDGTSSLIISGVQLEVGTTTSPFQPTLSTNNVGAIIPKRVGTELDVLGNELEVIGGGECVPYGSDTDYAGITTITIINKSITTDLNSDLLGRFSNLHTLDVPFNSIDVLDISENTLLKTVKINNNRLTALQNSDIIVRLDLNGLTNGYISYTNFGGGSLTAAATTAITSLNNKGWTVVVL